MSENPGNLLLKDFRLDVFPLCVHAQGIETIILQNQGKTKKWQSRNKCPHTTTLLIQYLQKEKLGTLRIAVNHWFLCNSLMHSLNFSEYTNLKCYFFSNCCIMLWRIFLSNLMSFRTDSIYFWSLSVIKNTRNVQLKGLI